MRTWMVIKSEHNRKWCEWHDLAYSQPVKSPRPPDIQARMDQLMREMAALDVEAQEAYRAENSNG